MRLLRALFLLFTALLSLPAGAQQSSKVKLLCQWNDTVAAPMNSKGHRYNEVWGFTSKGREYAVIGSTLGAHIIDVNTCKQVIFAPGRTGNASHRDYKTYRNLLYACSEDGQSTLQIFDTRYLPDSLPLVRESDPAYISRMHKLFIDTVTAKMYCPSFTNNTTGHDFMRVFSLQKPDSPVFAAVYNDNHGDIHDVYVRNDTAFCSASFAGYFVVDFSKSPIVRTLGGLTSYPYRGFNHSSWIGPDGIGVMADETGGSPLKVIDTRNLGRINVLSTFSPRGTDKTSVPHNPYIRGKFVFISYYLDGLQIYDLSDPTQPRQAGWYLTYTGPPYEGFGGAWGCYPYLPSRRVLISDMITGLYVFDTDEATGTVKNTTFKLYPNPAKDQLTLEFPEDKGGMFQCVIFDVTGRKLSEMQFRLNDMANPPVSLPLRENWPGGMYIIRATLGDTNFTAPFIKL